MKTIGFLRLLERSTEERGEKEPKDGKKVLESLVRYQVHCIYEISVFFLTSSSSGGTQFQSLQQPPISGDGLLFCVH